MTDDAWGKGPWAAGPLQPILPEFGKPVPEASTLPSHLGPLWDFGRELAKVIRDPRGPAFAELMTSPAYVIGFGVAFSPGYMSGGLHALQEWVGDLKETLERIFGEPLVLLDKLGDELVRGLVEDKPKGLSKETREVIDASNLAAPLKMLAILTAENDFEAFLTNLGLVVEDLCQMCIAAGDAWLDEFLAANGNAALQGFLLGELYAVATVQVIAFLVETAVSNVIIPAP